MGTFPMFPTSLTFSTLEGRDEWWGKGRTRVWMDGWEERSGSRVWRFLGVTKMVMVRPRMASWWVRSSIGSIWPCAGYGKIRM